MCIYPQYRVTRLLGELTSQRAKVQTSLNRSRSDTRVAALTASLTTLDWCIKQIREAADTKKKAA